MSGFDTGALIGLDIRSVGDSDDGLLIKGAANVTSVTDSYNTRFAFLPEALEMYRTNPIVLFNHDTSNPVGLNRLIEERGDELYVEDVIAPDARTPHGASLTDLIRRGIVRGLSIRFDPEGKPKRHDGYDLITVRRIPEHSIVTLPSNEMSLIYETGAVRMFGAPPPQDDQPRRRFYVLGSLKGVTLVDENTRAKLAPKDEKWSAPTLEDLAPGKSWKTMTEAEKKKVASHFLYVPDLDKFTSLKLPYKNAEGEVVLNALHAVASRLPNTDIPDDDKKKIETKLKSLYKEFGEEYPGGKKAAEKDEGRSRALDLRTETTRAAGLSFQLLIDRLQELARNGRLGDRDFDEWVVAVYDETFVYSDGYWATRYYEQGYKVEGEEVSLVGDPVEVIPSWTSTGAGDTAAADDEIEPRSRTRSLTRRLDGHHMGGVRAHIAHLRAMADTALEEDDCPPATVRHMGRSMRAMADDMERMMSEATTGDGGALTSSDDRKRDDVFASAIRIALDGDDEPSADDIATKVRAQLAQTVSDSR